MLPIRLRTPARTGHPDPANAPATLESIERAAGLAKVGEIANGVIVGSRLVRAAGEGGAREVGRLVSGLADALGR